MIELPFANGFYESRSKPLSNQQCVNLYPILIPSGLSNIALFGTPGVSQITSATNNEPSRGTHVMADILYTVNGDKFYRVNRTAGDPDTFSVTELGTVGGSGRVSMADNGTQLMVLVPGGDGYIWNGTTFAQITDVDFKANGNPQYVEYLDGYFVVSTDTKKFIISALNDGTAWDALDFATAEADPDTIVAPVVNRNQLFITGSETIEVFQNTGNADFPFQRVQGFVIPVGCFAPFSLVKGAGTFFFIGGGTNEGPTIRIFDGNNCPRISTDAVDKILEDASAEDLTNAVGWSYSQEGGVFVGWNIGERTIVYDALSQRWHERQSRYVVDNVIFNTTWRCNTVINAYNRTISGDALDGRIGEIDLDTYCEYGGEIRRRFSTVPFSNQGNSFRVPKIELTVESGVGDTETPDPLISMDRSLDGKTWKSPIIRGLGKAGEFGHRVIWRRLGRAKRFELFRFTISDKVKVVIMKLEGNIV